MAFNVFKYDSFVPFLSYQFRVDVDGFSGYVKDVQLPTFDIKSDCQIRYGSSQYHLPTFDFASGTIEITFFENDYLQIFSTFSSSVDFNSSSSSKYVIKIEKYDSSMTNMIWKRTFLCDLIECDAPSFSRNGAANNIELKVKFIVHSWYNDSNASSDNIYDITSVYDKQQVSDVTRTAPDKGLNYEETKKALEQEEKAIADAAKAYDEAAAKAEEERKKKEEEERKKVGDENNKNMKEEAAKREAAKAEEEKKKKEAGKQSGSGTPEVPAGPQAEYSGQGVVGDGKADGFQAFANDAYDAEMVNEGKKAQVFMDLNDKGAQKGNINLGTGSAMKARDFTGAVGEMDVKIGGVDMHFKSDEALNDAIKKAFGADYTRIMEAYQNKEISYAEAKKQLKALGKRTITDSNGKTAKVEFTGNMGYLNVELSEKDVQEVKSVNMKIDTDFGDAVKSTFMANLSAKEAANNVVLKDFIHSVHATSGMKSIIKEFGKDANNLKILADAIKQNKITKELSAALYKTINKSKLSEKTKIALAGSVVRTMDKTATANINSDCKSVAKANLQKYA